MPSLVMQAILNGGSSAPVTPTPSRIHYLVVKANAGKSCEYGKNGRQIRLATKCSHLLL
jgi:hypothetical protein